MVKIESVRIKHLRSISDELITFNDYTCLVGSNGAGKSTVHCALNLFFRETENVTTNLSELHEEDFHLKNTDAPVEVTVTFTDLSAEAQEDFSAYHRQGKLIISALAHYDKVARTATVKQYGQRLGISAFAPFFRAEGDGVKVADLKEIYSELKKTFDLPAPGPKAAMITALQSYEAARPGECELRGGSGNLHRGLKWSFCLTTARMAEDQELSWADGHGGTTQRPSRREWRWLR